MRSPDWFRLSFLVPAGVAMTGGHSAFDGRCSVDVEQGVVAVSGPSREAVFEAATEILVGIRRVKPVGSIAATLQSPLGLRGCRDGWSIITGGPIAFSPTSLDPYISERFFG